MCFKYIAFPHFCSNPPNTLQGAGEWGSGGGGGEENYKRRLNDREHWRGWLTLKAATQRDTVSKGIMDKWRVLQAHNSH